MVEARRKYLRDILAKEQIAAVLIDSPSNLYYYTGFTGGEAMFLMPVQENSALQENGILQKNGVLQENGTLQKNGAGKAAGYLITDSRYEEQVEKECPDLTLVRLGKKGYSEAVKELLPAATVALEDTMCLSRYLKLCRTCKECTFLPAGDMIGQGRMVKDDEELAKIARAEAIGDEAFTYILGVIKPGITEAEIALELEFFMKKKGASGLSFDTIVASGAHSSMPHAKVTDKRVEYGDFVTMDFGCIYKGYCSDMTRTVAVGRPTEEMEKVYRIVLEANLRAMEGIRAGVSCNTVDSLARDYIRGQGYGDYFGHGLGHGVGLDIHEEPRFSPSCEIVAAENMVITDEPGIYLPGRFGVRIEDLVVVKKDGYEKLSQSEKELIIL
ncbi:MAG: aminopeptidase P family protein [Bacteroidales bacterium]|nr:aminopeptidase P family protein [Clostridium sp.]MCM1202612.1 aminopeptidase P family protein [Bacteroidales bacterium]